jgi:hypothetical protein
MIATRYSLHYKRIKLPTSWQTGEAWRERMLSQHEWFAAVCESYLNPPLVVDGKELPEFSSDGIQANTTGQSGVNTLKEVFIFYQDCIDPTCIDLASSP